MDEIRNPIVALVAVCRFAARSGRGSPFHSLGRMKLADPPARTLGLLAVAGSALGVVMMLPILLQASLFRGLDQFALFATLCLYGYGIWSGVQAFNSREGWKFHARNFWLAQVPALSTSAVTFILSCGAGAWLFLRLGEHSVGVTGSAYLGSAYQWSYMQHKSESLLGLNLFAAAIAAWLTLALVRESNAPREEDAA